MSWRLTPRYFDARTPLLFAYLPPGFEGSLLLLGMSCLSAPIGPVLVAADARPRRWSAGRRRGGVFRTCVDGVFAFRHRGADVLTGRRSAAVLVSADVLCRRRRRAVTGVASAEMRRWGGEERRMFSE